MLLSQNNTLILKNFEKNKIQNLNYNFFYKNNLVLKKQIFKFWKSIILKNIIYIIKYNNNY